MNMMDCSVLGTLVVNHEPIDEPSDFDEAAFRNVRQNFQCLVHSFNEFADLTGQSPLQLEGSPPPRTDTDFATFINHDWWSG